MRSVILLVATSGFLIAAVAPVLFAHQESLRFAAAGNQRLSNLVGFTSWLYIGSLLVILVSVSSFIMGVSWWDSVFRGFSFTGLVAATAWLAYKAVYR